MLLSEKLCKLSEQNWKNKSLMNVLNKIGPRIDPYGTPETISLNRLRISLFLTHSLRPVRYDAVSFKAELSIPYASNFAIRRS